MRKYLAKENADQYLKKTPESLADKQLREYDLIVAMQHGHKDAVLTICPECESEIVVWRARSHDDAMKVYKQIKERVKELSESL